jgi:hypothetical protein
VTNRVKCESCGDWYCATHEGHIFERCDCWPCDDCGELVPLAQLDDLHLCPGCAVIALTQLDTDRPHQAGSGVPVDPGGTG